LFFALPGAVVDRVALWLGKTVGENPVVYLPAGQFPLLATVLLGLTMYALCLYAFCGPGAEFGICTVNRGHETEISTSG
jgi:hypothetical protein